MTSPCATRPASSGSAGIHGRRGRRGGVDFLAAGIELVGLTKRSGPGRGPRSPGSAGPGGAAAVDDIDRSVSGGEFFSLLGPSGCGKTSTLRLIAGLEEATAGRILLDGTDVSHVPPHRRNVNTVFQSYALFPFLSVFDNVAFGLKHAPAAKAELHVLAGDAEPGGADEAPLAS